MKVFVYGSLMRGFSNHHRLAGEGSQFLQEAETTPEFKMVSLGAFPGILEGGKTSIKGEVFEVDAEVKKGLDYLEGHPTFYRRTPITLLTPLALLEGEVVEAYILQGRGNRSHYDEVPNGDWKAWLSGDRGRDQLRIGRDKSL